MLGARRKARLGARGSPILSPERYGRRANEPGIIGAAIAGDVYAAVKKALTDHSKPTRASPKRRAGGRRKKKSRKRNLSTLAVIGANPMSRTRKSKKRRSTRRTRNASGQFVAKAKRRSPTRVSNRRATVRRKARRDSKKRRANKSKPTVVIIRERNSMAKANKKRSSRRRSSTRRRSSRRRNLPVGLTRARGRAHAYGARRKANRGKRGRRRNMSVMKTLTGKINFQQVLMTAGGVFAGDKAVTILPNMVLGANNTGMVATLAKVGVGLLGGSALWQVSPALGTGFVIGALNAWINEGFGYIWGMAEPYLGVSGLRDYRQQSWRSDNWLGARVAPQGALPAASSSVAGMAQVNPGVFRRPF